MANENWLFSTHYKFLYNINHYSSIYIDEVNDEYAKIYGKNLQGNSVCLANGKTEEIKEIFKDLISFLNARRI